MQAFSFALGVLSPPPVALLFTSYFSKGNSIGSFGNSHRKWDSVAGWLLTSLGVQTGGKCCCFPPDLCENSPQRGRCEAGCTAQRAFVHQVAFTRRLVMACHLGEGVTQRAELGSLHTRASHSGVSAQFSESRRSPKNDLSLPPPTAVLPQ